MDLMETKKSLRRLWPRVDPYEVVGVLRALEAEDAAAVEALLAAALALPGPDAATRLMVPIASALEARRPREQVVVLHALNALVRGGGDSTEILPAAAAALSVRETTQAAARLLCRAALAGALLPPIEGACAGSTDSWVRQAQRLGALQQRGEHEAVALLAATYRSQPIGNLRGAIGLVEGQLLSADREEAQAALQAMAAAGGDLYRCWFALLPVLLRQLRDPVAIQAMAQLRYTLKYAAEGEEAAAQDVPPRLAPVVATLSTLLDADGPLAAEAASTIQVFVGLGASLHGVRPTIEAALDSPNVGVRAACSRALSVWLQREGEERVLPKGQSHRRIFAASDDPLAGERPLACAACKFEQASVLYRHEDSGPTHVSIVVELLCPSCGLYSVQYSGY